MKYGKLRVVWMPVGIIAILICFLLLTFAIPVHVWRTGELPEPSLTLVQGGPQVKMTRRVWVDTDAACGTGRTTDPDDCFALLLLAHNKASQIVGISTVFGNASINVTDRITRRLVLKLQQDGLPMAKVYKGAQHAHNGSSRDTPAVSALRKALSGGPLTIIALGPLTNISAALSQRPDLQPNVSHLVVVMGRRPGHLFHPSEGADGGILFGHGPVFRDFNFEKDPHAVVSILSMGLPMTLVPYDVAREVSLTGADLSKLEREGGADGWVAEKAEEWLGFWKNDIGKNGFYPFDVLAIAYFQNSKLFNCASTQAVIKRDLSLWGRFYGPESLLTGTKPASSTPLEAESEVIYCPKARSNLHRWIMSEILN